MPPAAPTPSGPAPDHIERLLLQALLQQLTDCVYFKDRASRFIVVNNAMASRFGLLPEDLVGRTDFDLFTPEHARPAYDAEQRIIATGEPLLACEEKETWTDDFSTWVSTTKLPLRDLAGTIVGTFGISRDITARKQAEDEVQRSEATLRSLLTAAPIGISIVRDRVILTVNQMLTRISGYPSEELIGTNARRLYCDQAEYERVGRLLYSHLPEDGRNVAESTWRRPDGTVINVEIGAAPLDPADPAAGMAVTVIDTTGRHHAEAQRQELQLQLDLAHKLESIGRLAAGIAHEINTPGQFVADNLRFLGQSFAQLDRYLAAVEELRSHAAPHPDCAAPLAALAAAARDNELDFLRPEIPRCIAQSLDGLQRIARIVGALKDFSRPQVTGRTPAHLARLVETAVAVSRHEWEDAAELVADFDPAQPPVPVVIDEINQALLNLIVNAAAAVRAARSASPGRPGRIVLRTRTTATHACLEIEDNGTGIPDSVRPHLFEPFVTTQHAAVASGQGLHLVHRIVRRHGGRIDYATALGQGTTFRMQLPLVPPPPAPGPG